MNLNLKKLLIFVLTLTLSLGWPTSVGTAEENVLHVRADGRTLRAVEAYFTVDGDSSWVIILPATDDDGDGVFSLVLTEEITDTATTVYFVVTYADGAMEFTDPVSLADRSSNLFVLATETDTTPPSEAETTPPAASDPAAPPAQGSYTDKEGENTATIPVSGRVEAAELISVDITWEDMVFTYTAPIPPSEEETDLAEEETTPAWRSESNKITVTNYSAVEITAAFTFTKAETLDVAGEFRDLEGRSVTSVSLDAAEMGEDGETLTPTEESVTFHITEGHIDGDLDRLGTITVTISKP